MPKIGFFAALLLLVAATCVAEEEVSYIFNGENLDGWTIHGTELWYVEDGELVCAVSYTHLTLPPIYSV